MKYSTKSLLCLILPVLVALISAFALAGPMSSPETHKETIQYLEERRTVVLELTGASTAASVAITLLPGDTGTPIAEKLADLSSAFLVITTALVLEKYLVTLTGLVVFRFVIPLACLLLILFFGLDKESFLRGALRLLAFGLALFLLVPVSVGLSKVIENTYEDLHAAVNTALTQDETDLLEDGSLSTPSGEGSSTAEVSGTAGVPEVSPVESQTAAASSAAQTSVEESKGWWQKALDELSGRMDDAGSAVQQQIDKIKEDVAGIAQQVQVAPEKLSRLLNHYIEVVSVLIVTSCVIPILVVLVFYAMVKMLFSLDSIPLSALFKK